MDTGKMRKIFPKFITKYSYLSRAFMNGWMICDFTSFLTVFQSSGHTCQVSRFERDAHEFERLSRPHDRILKNTHNSRISRIITIFVFYLFNNS